MKVTFPFQKTFSIFFLIFLVILNIKAQKLNPSSISTNGTVNIIVQDSTTVYIGGSFTVAGYKTAGTAKINNNARVDINFPSLGGTCYTSIPDGSGGWYVGGLFSVQGLTNLVHILSSNTIDVSFAPNPNNTVRALYLDGSTLYAGGAFTQISGQTHNRLAAINATTGVLQAWDPAPDGTINSITKSGNTLYVGGSFNNIGGRGNKNFAAIDATTGIAIPSISASSTVNVIEQDTANLYIGGTFSGSSGYYTGSSALLNTVTDLPDFTFPIIGNGTIYKSIPDGNGGWYVGGSFSVQGLSNLVHILSNNTIDASFAPNPNNVVRALYLDGSTLYAGGSFTQISGQSHNRLAAVNATTGVLQAWDPAPDGTINSITKDGNIIYAGGNFQNIGGRGNKNFAAIDATTGIAIPSISASSTVSVIEQDAANLYLGGNFSGSNGYYTGPTALLNTATDLPDFNLPPIIENGTIYKSIPDGNGGWYVGGSFSVQGLTYLVHILSNNTLDVSFAPNPNNVVRALYLDGSTLYVGGSFTQISGQAHNRLAAVNATTGVLQAWNPAPDGTINSITKDGNIIYAGGSFNNIGGRGNKNFAAIDATTGIAIPSISASSTVSVIEQDAANLYLGGNFSGSNGYYTGPTALLNTATDLPDFNLPPIIENGTIYKSIPDGNGGWYVGGSFSVQGLTYLVHILSNNTLDVSFAPNPNNVVRALYLDGSTLYVGGSFTQISGQAHNRLAAVNATTGVLQAWNPAPDGTINSITKDGNIIYAGGSFNNIGGQMRSNIAAINATTGVSTSWSPNSNSTVNVLLVNGTEIIVGGTFTTIGGQSRYSLAALSLSTGNATSWNPSPNITNGIEAIELNGANVYVGGYFTTIGGQPRNHIAEISLSTGNATTWNPNASSTVSTIKLIGTTIYAGGQFTSIGGQARSYLAALNNTNGNATTWDARPSAPVYTLGVNGNSILTGGNFTYLKAANRISLMAVSKSNGLITSWNPSPNIANGIEAIELNGANVYVGGYFTTIGGQPRNHIAEISLSTGNATTWNPNASSTVSTIKLIGTTIYAGGQFTSIGGQARSYLAALNNTNGNATTWDARPSAPVYTLGVNGNSILTGGNFTYLKAANRISLMAVSKSNGLITSWNPSPNIANGIEAIELNGANVYVGGYFTTIGGQPRNHIAEISLSTGNATTWNPNASSTVSTIKLIGTTIYAGGQFTSIGGQARSYLAALNNTNGNATTWDARPSAPVYTLGVNGNSILTGGNFTYLKAANRISLMAVSKSNGLITSWNPSPNIANGIEAIELNGANVYVGGYFTTIGGQPRNHIAEISLSTGNATTWNPNASSTVSTIKLIGTTIYAGGQFTSIGGQPRNYLAALNNTNGNATTWNPKPNGTVFNIRQSGQDLIAIGSFSFTNSEQRSNLLSISKSTGLITSWNPAPNSTVETIEPNRTNAYVGGSFTTIGGQPRNRIAEISLLTGAATSWNPNANSTVKTIKQFGNKVYTGGDFTTIGGQNRNRLAAINNTIGTATTWNPNANSTINKLAISDSILYVSGSFTSISGQTRNHLASFTLQNETISTWNPNVSGTVNDVFVTGSTIYIGGSFSQVSGQNRSNLASFSKSPGNLRSWNPVVNGPVNSIITKGKFVYIGGGFNVVKGQNCNGYASINANTAIPELFFPNVTGQIRSLSSYDSSIYLGGSFSAINSVAYGGLATISYPNSFFKPSLDYVTPDIVGNGGEVSVSVFGNGFEDGTSLRLTKSGKPDILVHDTLFTIVDGIRLDANIDLHTSVDTGLWNVVVKIPNDTLMSLNNALRVAPYQAPIVETNILGFPNIRVNVWQNYTVSVSNTGNVDARGIPIYFAIDTNVSIEFSNKFLITDSSGNLVFVDTLLSFIPVDSLFSKPYHAKVYAVILGNIPGGVTDFITFKVKTNSTEPFNLRVWSDPPLYGSPMKPEMVKCVVDIATTMIGLNPTAGCILGVYKAVIDPSVKLIFGGPSLAQYDGPFLTTGVGGYLTDIVWGMTKALVECTLSPVVAVKNVHKILDVAFNLASAISSGNDIATNCIPAFNQIFPPITSVTPVVSRDPNDKKGPLGYGTQNYIQSKNSIPYIIRFENVSTASASAQSVEIIDTLDLSVFDVNTLNLGGIQIGNRTISVPFGLQSYTTDVDLRPENNLLLRIKITFNKSTGVIRWLFTSIDLTTLQPTIDPLAGFLPPNTNSPNGEGSVTFTIKMLPQISNGSQIKNKAYIYFDANSPIVTNLWENTVDNIKPQSQIRPTAAIQYEDSTILLHWVGSDLGSGIRDYSIYSSVNGSAFSLFKSNVSDTSILFTGKLDKTYSFFTIATDSVGNVETVKNTGEATITFKHYPTDSICVGANLAIASGNSASGNTYQWQISTEAGYQNITNNAVYSNTTGDTLKLSAPPSSYTGNKYRCLITKAGQTVSSAVHTVRFVNKWTGAVNTAWENTANWSCGVVPDVNTEVIVRPIVPNFPTINSNVSCRSITAGQGIIINISSGFKLDVTGQK